MSRIKFVFSVKIFEISHNYNEEEKDDIDGEIAYEDLNSYHINSLTLMKKMDLIIIYILMTMKKMKQKDINFILIITK